MKKIKIGIVILLAFSIMNITYATEKKKKEEEIKKKVTSALPNTSIDTIRPIDINSLYEITTGKNILYVDKDVKYLFVGGIYDLANNINLTEARLREINRVEFDQLDFKNAIKTGKGKRELAIFYDPDCPFCRSQYHELKKADITVYIFLYPLPMHPQAYDKTVAIWCSEERIKVLETLLNGKTANTSAPCKTPIEQNIKTAENLQITATPTIILDTGEIIAGFISATDLKNRMGIKDE